jgi:hypothetical protein
MIPALQAAQAAANTQATGVTALHYIDDGHVGTFRGDGYLHVENTFNRMSQALETTMGCKQNQSKCFAYNAHTSVTLCTPRCTPLPSSAGIVQRRAASPKLRRRSHLWLRRASRPHAPG